MLTAAIEEKALATAQLVSEKLKTETTIPKKRKTKRKRTKAEELRDDPTYLKERNRKAVAHEHKHYEHAMPARLKGELTKKKKQYQCN